MSAKLELIPGQWYGWQMLPGYSERYSPYFSPIQVERTVPRKTGKRIITLAFFNALYAEGVQNFQIDLRILSHGPHYLIAELLYGRDFPEPERAAIVSDLDSTWLQRFCPGVWDAVRSRAQVGAEHSSISTSLDALFGSAR